MTSPAANSSFDTLLDLGLITATQHAQALAHPQRHELDGHPGEASALVWMVVRKIVDDELTSTTPPSRDTAQALNQRSDILSEAHGQLAALREVFNEEHFDALLSEGLIDPVQREAALSQLSPDELLASPAAALAWMVIHGVITPESYNDLHTRVTAEPAFATARQRAAIVTETQSILEQTGAALHKEATRLYWRSVFPGPPLLWIGAVVIGISALVWHVVTPNATPSCTSSATEKTLASMFFKVGLQARMSSMRSGQEAPPSARAKNLREVGYLQPSRVRGCMAELDFGGHVTPYAFTISPNEGEDGGYKVAGADERIVEARFGNLDKNGHSLNQAEPVGREALETAFRAGVDKMSSGMSGARQRLLESIRNREGRGSEAATERDREIAEVEPIGPCKEVTAGTRYTCTLLVERNDTLLSAMGAGSLSVLRGEFGFERSAVGQPWQVTSEFTNELATAIVRSRMETMTGRAASKPDEAGSAPSSAPASATKP
jgi:hypothetical protein